MSQANLQTRGFAGAHNIFAWLLATCPGDPIRDGQHSLEHAQRVVKLVGDNGPSMLDSLAAAYAELGDFPQGSAVAAEGGPNRRRGGFAGVRGLRRGTH